MKSRLSQLFGIDLRTLAWLRIGLAFLVLLDLGLRARDLSAHYTDQGILPRSALITDFLTRWSWSFHLFNGTAAFQAMLFLVAATFALAMLVGYKTRIATVTTWVLLCSLQTRNPAICPAVDNALRLFLFWSMFMPLGAVWSVDQLLHPKRHRNPYLSVAGVGFMAQLAFIYIFTVIQKSDPAWREDFTAIYYALSLDDMATSIGLALRSYPGLMKALTVITISLEAAAPILVFTPFYTAWVRMVVILAMMMLHLGMGLALTIGLFPFVMWVGWWVFIPGVFWDKIGVTTGSSPEGPHLADPATTFSRARAVAGQSITAAALVYILLYNLRVSDPQNYWAVVSRPANAFGTVLNLKQNWGVFAPRPHLGDGWYVMPGELVNGETVDLFRGGAPVRFAKPDRVTDDFPNDRWRKYVLHLRDPGSKQHLPYYLGYLCQRWNEKHLGTNQLVRSVSVYFMEEFTLPDGKTRPIEKHFLARHNCLEDDA
ncbi:MAG: HTTM domain-containing protein [Myxococcales bacterium]|nr:HTTM domain-containing protein [Myxococcales bacterium]